MGNCLTFVLHAEKAPLLRDKIAHTKVQEEKELTQRHKDLMGIVEDNLHNGTKEEGRKKKRARGVTEVL